MGTNRWRRARVTRPLDRAEWRLGKWRPCAREHRDERQRERSKEDVPSPPGVAQGGQGNPDWRLHHPRLVGALRFD